MSHGGTRAVRLAAFRAAVAALDPTSMLQAAEAAGNMSAAAEAIGTLAGYVNRIPQKDGDLNNDERFMLNQVILQRLFDLRPIAKAKGFTWYF
jgi:hypothetical protein